MEEREVKSREGKGEKGAYKKENSASRLGNMHASNLYSMASITPCAFKDSVLLCCIGAKIRCAGEKKE